MNGYIEWKCPSNIALIKYWGKRTGQLPVNPSLSITLSESFTNIQMEYEYNSSKSFSLEFLFNNQPNREFDRKIDAYIQDLAINIPELTHVKLKIKSYNSFPHSAGIASSASSFGALALALSNMLNEITGIKDTEDIFFKKASSMARTGSGSACRSVYGGYVLWGSFDGIPGSSDETALPVTEVNPEFMNIRDSILVVSSAPKSVSSTKGHQLMDRNIYSAARKLQARDNLKKMLDALKERDIYNFISIMENEALSLHAMMMTSSPGYILMKPGTLEIIKKVRELRSAEGIPVGFTLDAGPNVHLLYMPSFEERIRRFIDTTLAEYCENVIYDMLGKGPEKIVQHNG